MSERRHSTRDPSRFWTSVSARRLLQALPALIVIVSLLVILELNRTARAEGRRLAESAISDAIRVGDALLAGHLGRIEVELEKALVWTRGLAFDEIDPEALEAQFIPVLRSHDLSSGVLIADEHGNGLNLIPRSEGGWVTEVIDSDGPERYRILADVDHLIDEHTRESGDDPRERPWFRAAAAARDPARPTWVEPYAYGAPPELGISVARRQPFGHPGLVIAFDVRLSDLCRYLELLRITPGMRPILIGRGNRLLGFAGVIEDDSAGARAAELLWRPFDRVEVPLFADAARAFRDKLNVVHTGLDARLFRSEGEWFWGGSGTMPHLGFPALLAFGIPETDLVGDVPRRRSRLLGIGLIATAMAVVLTVRQARFHRGRLAAVIGKRARIGAYDIDRQIGEGGAGIVYSATHALLGRRAAIKLLRTELFVDEPAEQRFEREVQLTAQLEHPNTVRVYDFGRTTEGRFYYVMEFVDGVDLGALVRLTGALPAERVIHILRQVCGSLAEAHDAGLVHRDLKPENIMLTARGGHQDVVKVLDFGAVKVHGETGLLTPPAVVLGTLESLAPEVVLDPSQVGAAADLYALGALGRFLMTGRPEFEGQDVRAVLRAHLEHEAQPLEDGVAPPDLDYLLMQCLAKNPRHRPASAREVVRHLDECAHARRWTEKRAAEWWRQFVRDSGPLNAESAAGRPDLGTRRG